MEAAGFEFLKEGNPIDARGFHGDRLDAAVHKPVRQCLEVSGVRAKGAHDLLVLTVRHTGHNLMRPNIDSSGLGGDLCACPANGRASPWADRTRWRRL